MCEIEPHIFFPIITGIGALSIGIEYLYEQLVREKMIDRQFRRLLCVLTGALTCGISMSESWQVTTVLDILLLISGLHGVGREPVKSGGI
jgi:hypothetical protein